MTDYHYEERLLYVCSATLSLWMKKLGEISKKQNAEVAWFLRKSLPMKYLRLIFIRM